MAIKSTIYKCTLTISDMDRQYYADHVLTIALHPSETLGRMMYRLIAYALHASDRLQFTRGISTDDEPDIWLHDFSNRIELWIDLGQPDEKRIRRACSRANQVYIYTYSGHGAELWWQQTRDKLERFDNLTVISLPAELKDTLADMAGRSMIISCTIQDGHMVWSNDTSSLMIEPLTLKP